MILQRVLQGSSHVLGLGCKGGRLLNPLCLIPHRKYTHDPNDFDREKDTIFALSTPQGRSGVAVVRVSGREAHKVLDDMCKFLITPETSKLSLTPIQHPQTRELLDKGMAAWFKAPNSFTGEDVVELHLHGSVAVVRNTLEAIQAINNKTIRPAKAGEFTRRAFENGKMDLVQVEALGDLLDSETESQRKLALSQLSGNASSLYQYWKTQLKYSLAHVEAMIDFAEDQQIEDEVYDAAVTNIEDLCESIQNHLGDKNKGEIIRSGIKMTIFGPPNVGKSSLLNILAQRPVAITSPIAGTTRDVLEVSLNIDGYPVIVSDTAGIRETADPIEIEGVKRAQLSLESAHMKLLLLDPEHLALDDTSYIPLVDKETIVVVNKSELLSDNSADVLESWRKEIARKGIPISAVHTISCKKETGFTDLLSVISRQVKGKFDTVVNSGQPIITRERHRRHLTACLSRLGQYLAKRKTIDIAAEELRLAIHEIGCITGHVHTEELLDIIFKDFCIGK